MKYTKCTTKESVKKSIQRERDKQYMLKLHAEKKQLADNSIQEQIFMLNRINAIALRIIKDQQEQIDKLVADAEAYNNRLGGEE